MNSGPRVIPGTSIVWVRRCCEFRRTGSILAGEPREVEVTEFWLSDCEVTVGQFQALLPEVKTNQIVRRHRDPSGTRKPVGDVTWFDAVKFCNELSRKRASMPTTSWKTTKGIEFQSFERAQVEILMGNGYRLPKEMEWEIACRAGTITEFSFGNDEADLSDYGWFDVTLGNNPPCGGEEAESVGPARHARQPLGMVRAFDKGLLRGGRSTGRVLRVGVRLGGPPGYRNISVGFRVARSPSGKSFSFGVAQLQGRSAGAGSGGRRCAGR